MAYSASVTDRILGQKRGGYVRQYGIRYLDGSSSYHGTARNATWGTRRA